jgi:gamma-glutamyltranspeptidase/glutathione hydrolase
MCPWPAPAAVVAVAQGGAEVLYGGKYAAGLVSEIAAAGGVLSLQDLQRAQPLVRQPLRARAMGVSLIVPPPPSSGAAVLSALAVLAGVRGCGPAG